MVDKDCSLSAEDGYARLHDAIISGRLQPNERLVEAELIDLLGVSRTAVRTALVRLAQEGLVVHERNRGARVRYVDETEAVEIVLARAALEALAVRQAAEHATPDDVAELRAILGEMRARLDEGDLLGASEENAVLHAKLLELSGNRTVIRLVGGLKSQLVRFQYRTILVPGPLGALVRGAHRDRRRGRGGRRRRSGGGDAPPPLLTWPMRCARRASGCCGSRDKPARVGEVTAPN